MIVQPTSCNPSSHSTSSILPSFPSRCIQAVNRIYQNIPKITADTVAVGLITCSALTGIVHAINNEDPAYKNNYDLPGGAAIVLGSSLIISSVMAAKHFLAGRTQQAKLWAIGALAAGLPLKLIKTEPDPMIWQECEPNSSNSALSTRINRLPCSLFEEAKGFVDGTTNSLSRWSHTATFPVDIPVVIKKSDGLVKIMELSARIVRKSNYRHLLIARSSEYKDYAIQSLLPIPPRDHLSEVIHQIQLYLNHHDLFDEAAREFTGFLVQSRLGDLDTIMGGDFFGKVTGPRFDNCFLYLDQTADGAIGKVILADLDHFGTVPQINATTKAVSQAIRFFPHHMESIIAAAKEFDSSIEKHRAQFEEAKGKALEFFDRVYTKPLAIIKSKGITHSNRTFLPPLSPAIKKRIQNDIADEIWCLHLDKCTHPKGYTNIFRWFLNEPSEALSRIHEQTKHHRDETGGFSGKNLTWLVKTYDKFYAENKHSKTAFEQFKQKLPLAIDYVVQKLHEQLELKAAVENLSDTQISSTDKADLVIFRTIMIGDSIPDQWIDDVAKLADMANHLDVRHLIDMILEQMEKQGIILFDNMNRMVSC